MREEWREVPDFPDYEVSDQGRVRSWKRMGNGAVQGGRAKTPHIITPKMLNTYGHKFVETWENKKRTKHNLHRLVLTVFDRPPREGERALHKNNDPADNRVDNLYWGSAADNSADMVRAGHSQRGEKNTKAKLTERDVHLIQRMNQYMKHQDIAEVFEVSTSAISLIFCGKNWKWL